MKFNEEELKIIKKAYDEGVTKFKTHSIISSIIGIIALILPPEIWNMIGLFKKKKYGSSTEISGFIYEDFGSILLVIVSVVGFSALSYFAFVHYLKKDLKHQEKIIGTFKVVRVEHYSKRLSKELDGLDTALHFEKNDKKVKKHVFKKTLNPEYVNATAILIERAKYSNKIFKSEIII